MADIIFSVGERVIACGHYGWHLTPGAEYTVIKYEPEYPDHNFTWPAYVTVIGDHGKPVVAHTYRFKKVK